MRGSPLTPRPLYPRAYFFVGSRERPKRRLLSGQGGSRKDTRAVRCPHCPQIFNHLWFFPDSLPVPPLSVFLEDRRLCSE